MDPDTEFRHRGVCLTCHKRSFRLNTDGICLKCFTRPTDLRPAHQIPLRFEAVPRRGWDIGVCVLCGYIKTCRDSVCRQCREQL